MDKKRLFTILSRADESVVKEFAEEIKKDHSVVIVKAPQKTLAMIKMREPVKQSLFYLGEVIVCEAVIELEEAKGMAVTMGDNEEKTLNIAIIDGAVNKGIFIHMDKLLVLEKQQQEQRMRENAIHLKTMVNFESMDGEAPDDISAFKKT